MNAIRIRVGYDTQGSESDHLLRETNTSYVESKLEICICSFSSFSALHWREETVLTKQDTAVSRARCNRQLERIV
jgi:hypothetical protein